MYAEFMTHHVAPIAGRKSAYVARNRAALIKSAQEVLAKRGPAATVDEIAEHAGIAVSTIYKHLPSKDELFEIAFVTGMHEWEEWIQSSIADVTDPIERLIFPMRLMTQLPQTHPLFANMIARYPIGFLKAVPMANFGLTEAVHLLVTSQQVNESHLEVRIKNVISVFAIETINICMNGPQKNSVDTISIAVEMLGLKTEMVADVMQRPFPFVNN